MSFVFIRYILSFSTRNSYSLSGVKPIRSPSLILKAFKELLPYFTIPILDRSFSRVTSRFFFSAIGFTKQKSNGAFHFPSLLYRKI